jgi:hypothetical protein
MLATYQNGFSKKQMPANYPKPKKRCEKENDTSAAITISIYDNEKSKVQDGNSPAKDFS